MRKSGGKRRRPLHGAAAAAVAKKRARLVAMEKSMDIPRPPSFSFSPPSELEAKFYYYGSPSRPVLVARTGITWERSTGPGAFWKIKELRPVGNHSLTEIWEDDLAPKVLTLLDKMQVKWTSIDVVRIGNTDAPSAPVILWIGVIPASLSSYDGTAVAFRCKDILFEYNITDVDVEIRESVVTHSPRLLPLQSSSPQPPSEIEAKVYYYGLPSRPVLVARTGITWERPTGPGAFWEIKELRPVGNHPLTEIWEDDLAPKILTLLDEMEVKWTSIDVIRIGNRDESFAPVILWIGVIPASLSGNDGVAAASRCRKLLVEHNITDIDVEIRESVVTHLAGPKLLTPTTDHDYIVDVREPLTTTLGLPICAQSTPWAEGTGGFFITESGNTERLLLVTARHVVFKPDKNKNTHFEYKNNSQRRYNVTLFGNAAFNKYLESIRTEIRHKTIITQYHERQIRDIEGRNDSVANRDRQEILADLDKTKKAIDRLNDFYQDVSTQWATEDSRILGHVILSPPISIDIGDKGYTEDWAIIEIDASKINTSNFTGNAIDLGTDFSMNKFVEMMHPNHWNTHSFTYPKDHLLRLRGTISDEEMRHPTSLGQNDESCIMVIKRGKTTGLTVGRATNIYSFTRHFYNGEKGETSKEWAILPYNSNSGAFSDRGDSGAVIVDGQGRIGGLLTSGAGLTDSTDITYATPISFLLKCIQNKGLRSPNISPVLRKEA